MLIFNLLPIYPTDGFHILEEILLLIYDETYTFDLLKWLTYLFLALIFIVAIIFKSIALIIISLYIIIKFKKYLKYGNLKALKKQIFLTNYFKKN